MKKLFSYLLISSMVVLSSCTNYDDQFDDLNTQINSLKSQIEGFSSLSSGLASLQGTVSALSSAVNALPKTATPATDVSGLEAAVAALQAQLANAATSAEVAALTADLAATQTALEATIASNATDLSALEAAVAALENTDTSTLEAAVAELKTALASAATSAEVAALQTAIDALENTDLTDVSASLTALQTALDLLENTDLSGITASVATLNTLVTATQASVTANTTDIEAISASLAALSDTIAELKATLATVSTAEEVSALAADLVAAQADLDVLLAQSSFYTSDLTINDATSLAFANALGSKINVVQGNVTITQDEDMDVTTLTAVMSRLVTVTKKVTYSSTSSATTQLPLANLTSVGAIEINQSGDISLPKLATVVGFTGNNGDLTLIGDSALTGEDVTETVSLPLLTRVNGAMLFNTISKATTFSMPSMVEHDGDVQIVISSTGTIDISAFKNDTLQEDGTASAGDLLTVTAGTLTAPVYTVGKIIGSEIDAVSLPLWEGTNDSEFPNASSVVLPSITAKTTGNAYDLTTLADKATSIHIVGNTFTTGSTPVTYEISVSGSQDDVETLILGGTFGSVNLTDNIDLTTLTFDATAEDFTLHGSDVVSLEMDLISAAAVTDGLTSVTIEDNDELTSLTVNGTDNLNALVITGNGELSSISFPDLDSASGAAAIAQISDNNLAATMTETAVSAAVSTFKTTGSSGIQNLKDFLDSVITLRKSTVRMTVKIDSLTSIDDEGAETVTADYLLIDLIDAVITPGPDAIAQTQAWVLDNNGSKTIQITVDGDAVFRNDANVATALPLSNNMDLAVTELKAGIDRADDLGLVLSAQPGSKIKNFDIVFYAATDSSTQEDSSATVTDTRLDASDIITLEIGASQSVTTTVVSGAASTTTGIVDALIGAWSSAYGTASTLYTLSEPASGTLRVSVSEFSGNRAVGHAVKVSARNDSGVNSGTTPLISYVAGDTDSTSDNVLKGQDVILTLTNKIAGSTDVTFPQVVLSGTTSAIALGTTLDYADATTADDYKGNAWPTEARTIVIPGKDDVNDTPVSSAATVDNTAKL